MAEFIKDGFKFYNGFYKNPVFLLDSSEFNSKFTYFKNNKLKCVSLDDSLLSNEFFEDLSFVEEVYFSSKIDINILYCMTKVKRMIINVDNKCFNINFLNFPLLENLSIDWFNSFPDLSGNKNLKELSIWKFKPKTKSLAELSLPEKLEKLHITESNILNFKGLSLSHLEEFEGHHCNSLDSINGIDGFNNNLKVLILEYCKKLSIGEELKDSKSLEKLILGDCAEIVSLSWLKYLKNLKHFSFRGTKLNDGDVSPCFGINYVSFKDQKHFNHKLSEFRNK